MRFRPLLASIAPVVVLFGFLTTQGCVATGTQSTGKADNEYGQFRIKRTPAQLMAESTMQNFADLVDANDEITWQVYVPKSYDPEKPAGLLVYISPAPFGDMPSGWRPIFDDENLIWISADRSGNRARTKDRILFATLAPYVVSERYAIDPERIYLSGFSGGGKAASIAAVHFANLFAGAIYICGVEFWSGLSPSLLSQVQSNRYVFVTGGRDFNRLLTGSIYRKYEDAGVPNIKLMTIPGMGHDTPDTNRLRDAIQYLDRRE